MTVGGFEHMPDVESLLLMIACLGAMYGVIWGFERL